MPIIPPEERLLNELSRKADDTNKRLEAIEKLLGQIVGMMADEIAFNSANPLGRR